jgi:hypothetical protein
MFNIKVQNIIQRKRERRVGEERKAADDCPRNLEFTKNRKWRSHTPDGSECNARNGEAKALGLALDRIFRKLLDSDRTYPHSGQGIGRELNQEKSQICMFSVTKMSTNRQEELRSSIPVKLGESKASKAQGGDFLRRPIYESGIRLRLQPFRSRLWLSPNEMETEGKSFKTV